MTFDLRPSATRDPYQWAVRYICERVAEALEPFEPGNVTLVLDHDYTGRRTLTVEVPLLPKDPYTMLLEQREMLHPELGFIRLGEEVFRHYRNRRRIEPEDHIILGTE